MVGVLPSTSRTPHPVDRRGGYTIMEILVVLGILSVLFGISAAVYQRLSVSYELPTAKSKVMSVLQSARNASRSAGLPSRVLIETGEAQRVTAFGYKLVAGLHFEEAGPYLTSDDAIPAGTVMRAAFNEKAEVYGEAYAISGRVGSAIEFVDEGAAVVMEYRPSYYSPRGFSLEAWVLFEEPPMPKKKSRRKRKGAWVDPRREQKFSVISLIGSYEMGILGDGAVYLDIGDFEATGVHDEDRYRIVTDAKEVVSGRWTHLRGTYNGLDFVIEIDGVEREWYPDGFDQMLDWPDLPSEIPNEQGALCISRPDAMFRGIIDEPKVRVALPPKTYEIEPGVRLLGETRTVYFDTRGSLDPQKHFNPFIVQLTDAPEEVDDELVGHTAVAQDTQLTDLADEDVDEEESEEGDEVDDVMEALAKYLHENQEQDNPDLIDLSGMEPVEASNRSEDEQGPSHRVETILIDLTGTIRG